MSEAVPISDKSAVSKSVDKKQPVEAKTQQQQEEDITKLELFNLKEHPDRLVESFKLFTDAQAQRRNLTNNVIIKNPSLIGGVCLLISFIFYQVDKNSKEAGEPFSWPTLFLSVMGVIIGVLSVVGKYTNDIMIVAERMTMDELLSPACEAYSFIYKNIVVGSVSILPPPEHEDYIKEKKEQESRAEKEKEEYAKQGYAPPDKITVYLPMPEGTALITGWSVLRRYRGVGLGKDLLDKAIDVAQNKFKAKELAVYTESTELPAIHILKSKGFKLVKQVPCHRYRGSWFGIKKMVWVKTFEKGHKTTVDVTSV